MRIDSISETPKDPPTDDEKLSYVLNLSKEIVQYVWHQPSMTNLAQVLQEETTENEEEDGDGDEEESYAYCFCKLCMFWEW